jgi:U2-associated protein SR140
MDPVAGSLTTTPTAEVPTTKPKDEAPAEPFKMSFKISLSKKQLNAKAKAEQEEKDRQEEEDRKRVLADFLNEHGDDEDGADDSGQAGDSGVYLPQGARRHHAARARSMKSGPGTLPAGPRLGNSYAPGFGAPQGPARALQNNRRDDEAFKTVIAKASNLPPDMKPEEFDDLFADFKKLKIVKVEKLPTPRGPPPTGRPTTIMKVHFDKDVIPRDLDDAINKLNDKKYVRCGYYLHLDRFLGDRAENVSRSLPFGAREVYQDVTKDFAPTAELSGRSEAGVRGRMPRPRDRVRTVITAYPPADPNMLKIVHMTIEGVMKGGIEFEAALMATPRAQKDERWAFLYDASHPVARYYRYRMYQLANGGMLPPNKEIFQGCGEWEGGEPLPDEFAVKPEQLDRRNMKDLRPDYEDDSIRGSENTIDPYPGQPESTNGILTPMSRTMLIHLLSSIPPSAAQNHEIAPISLFAINHATRGMDEIIRLIVWNILKPFSMSTDSNPRYRPTLNEEGVDTKQRRSILEATLNALRVVFDVIMTTHKEGGKSWKYRDAIGKELRDRNVFEYLETLEKKLDMGRKSKEDYQIEVNSFIDAWKKEWTFGPELLDHFDNAFNWRRREMKMVEEQKKKAEKRERSGKERDKSIGKVQAKGGAEDEDPNNDLDEQRSNAIDTNSSEQPSSTVNRSGSPNLQPSNHSTGIQSMKNGKESPPRSRTNRSASTSPRRSGSSGDVNAKSVSQAEQGPVKTADLVDIPGETAAARARRMRPKAEDMFASDEE